LSCVDVQIWALFYSGWQANLCGVKELIKLIHRFSCSSGFDRMFQLLSVSGLWCCFVFMLVGE
jgi:hypothetical protein